MFEPSAPNVKTDAPLTVSVSLSVMSPVVAVAARVPVTAPCKAKAASLVIAVLPAAVRITFASASKVSKVMPTVATSFKVTLPVADKFELSVMPPVVAVAARVPVTAPCNAKATSLVIAVSPAAVRITFASASKSIQGDAGGCHIIQGYITRS